ncbi:integrating conjugative element protein, partial [Erwinia amylovora]|nr:integrating conjugative element protein [Erwinia amylovora]
GFSPLLEDATKENLEQMGKLVDGQLPPTADNLAGIRTGSLEVTRGVIQALRDDRDKAALVQRLAGERALADTEETALTMRRMLPTGQSEPHAAGQTEAIGEGDLR